MGKSYRLLDRWMVVLIMVSMAFWSDAMLGSSATIICASRAPIQAAHICDACSIGLIPLLGSRDYAYLYA